jgi:hypothetical protein
MDPGLCIPKSSRDVGGGGERPRGQSIALHKPAWSLTVMLTLATDPRHDKSWASRTAPECKPATRDRVRAQRGGDLGPVRSTEEPEDGADERPRIAGPTRASMELGLTMITSPQCAPLAKTCTTAVRMPLSRASGKITARASAMITPAIEPIRGAKPKGRQAAQSESYIRGSPHENSATVGSCCRDQQTKPVEVGHLPQNLEGESAHKERHGEWSQQECSDVPVHGSFLNGPGHSGVPNQAQRTR